MLSENLEIFIFGLIGMKFMGHILLDFKDEGKRNLNFGILRICF